MSVTYNNFKIGQNVTCVKIDDTVDEHLTIGKTYKIEDLDFHFHDKICVKSNKKIYMFFKIEYFEKDIKIIRKLKIENIQKNIKK